VLSRRPASRIEPRRCCLIALASDGKYTIFAMEIRHIQPNEFGPAEPKPINLRRTAYSSLNILN
jgi:hypothetical protein